MSVTFIEEYRTVDKSDWGSGRWTDEPDKAVWVDEATNLDCMIVRGPSGALCGYVGIPESHRFYGRDYMECEHGADCDDRYSHDSSAHAIDVHGGLTFAAGCAKTDDPSKHVCHIPQAGRPHDVWWFGFDCAHLYDISPATKVRERSYYEKAKAEGDEEGMRLWGFSWAEPGESYKGINYVIHEVERLAAQLVAPTPPGGHCESD